MTQADAVFFISFGGPEKREDIRPFLEIVTRGRHIPAERINEVAHHYELIGGASPINAITLHQADGLRRALALTDTPWPVYVGNRNWHPFIEETLQRMADDGIRHTIGFVTAAHRTEASWQRYMNAVEAARQKVGPRAPTIDYVSPWFDHPLFIEAICERIKETLEGVSPHPPIAPSPARAVSWVFTAHSIPTPMAQNSGYVQELKRTADLVTARFGNQPWTQAYTSRSGVPADPWLEPDICDVIRAHAQRGVKDMLVIPAGFVADHVEVLFDLDIEAQEAARSAGLTLHRAPTVGEHPLFIQMMRDVVRQQILKETERIKC